MRPAALEPDGLAQLPPLLRQLCGLPPGDRIARGAHPLLAPLCGTGYLDPWELYETMRTAKSTLSMCMCIQLLKIVKVATGCVPKLG